MMYHFIGIKGAGLSSLACLLHDLGLEVQGSDVSEYFYTEDNLIKRKIKILPFDHNNIKKEYTVIVGNAFLNNEEHKEAMKLGCEVYTYNEYVGLLSKKYFSVAVSGTHGKTTTTNMIKQILAAKEPVNFLIGDGQGGGAPNNDLFVFEACEYRRHFLKYWPKVLVITNIDYDHPDYFTDIKDVQDAFSTLVAQSTKVVYNGDDACVRAIIPHDKDSSSFGLDKDNTYHAENITNDHRYTYYDLYIHDKYLTQIKIPLFGSAAVYNSLAAIATTHTLVNDIGLLKNILANYVTSKRRFEEVIINNQVIISDYAHHPTEIKATLDAIHVKYPFRRVIVYFQPHTYSRTIALFKEFCESLSLADKVYLREIFSSAREHEAIISINHLSEAINNSEVINDDEYIEEFAKYNNAVIVFMGAGDIDKLYAKYIQKMQKKDNLS